MKFLLSLKSESNDKRKAEASSKGKPILVAKFEAGNAMALRDALCNALIDFVLEGKNRGFFGDNNDAERAAKIAKAEILLDHGSGYLPLRNYRGKPFKVDGHLPSKASDIFVSAEVALSDIEEREPAGKTR